MGYATSVTDNVKPLVAGFKIFVYVYFHIIEFNLNTVKATPGDLSLVLPKRILDGIIEMIYALDKVAPGTENDDTLLYGVEVKFYNMEVNVDEKLESRHKGLYIIGDGSGITHSLSHASASGVHVARCIAGGL